MLINKNLTLPMLEDCIAMVRKRIRDQLARIEMLSESGSPAVVAESLLQEAEATLEKLLAMRAAPGVDILIDIEPSSARAGAEETRSGSESSFLRGFSFTG